MTEPIAWRLVWRGVQLVFSIMLVIRQKVSNIDPIAVEGGELSKLINVSDPTFRTGADIHSPTQAQRRGMCH